VESGDWIVVLREVVMSGFEMEVCGVIGKILFKMYDFENYIV